MFIFHGLKIQLLQAVNLNKQILKNNQANKVKISLISYHRNLIKKMKLIYKV